MSVSLRWGSSSFDVVGADTRKLRGPKRRVLVHETIRSRRSVDRSLARMIGRPLLAVFTSAHTYIGWTLSTMQSNAISTILNLMCHGPLL